MLLTTFFCLLGLTIKPVIGIEVRGPQSGVWTSSKSPYTITGDITIPSGETLIIENGSIVKFADYYGIKVDGTLIAMGITRNRIVFTSIHDKEFGVTGQPTSIMPTNKDWKGIEFTPSSGQTSKLDNCIIRFSDNIIMATFANPTLTNLVIDDCNAISLNVNNEIIPIQEGTKQDYNVVLKSANIAPLIEIPRTTGFEKQAESPQKKHAKQDTFNEEEFTFDEISVSPTFTTQQTQHEVTVITSEEIKQSGAINIPELLRVVPGFDVMGVTGSDYSINARGFNRISANKMLVKIDGRVTYMNFTSHTIYSALPIALEEIKQIEVTRSSGSILNGPNALCGTINIVTKQPEDMESLMLSITAGEKNTYIGTVVNSGIIGKVGYRTSFGWDRANQWDNTNPYIDNIAQELRRANIYFEYQLNDNSRITVFGTHNIGAHDIVFETIGSRDIPLIKTNSVGLCYNHPNLMIKLYGNLNRWGSEEQADVSTLAEFKNRIRDDNYNAEFNHFFLMGSKNKISYGANFRINITNSTIIGGYHQHRTYAAFLQDEYKPWHSFSLILGARYDKHPLTSGCFSPTGSIIFSPFTNHTLRFSYSTSFKHPNFLELYSVFESPLDASGTFKYNLLGNEYLNPTKLTSYEFGYNFEVGRLKANFDIFFNQMINFIDIINIGSTTDLVTDKYFNLGKATAYGGELGMNFQIVNSLSTHFNYSYQKIKDQWDDPLLKVHAGSSPIHKANFVINFKPTTKLSANLLVHYVDETDWKRQQVWNTSGKVGDYTIINARIGYQLLLDKVELSIAGYNLLNNKHYEYPAIIFCRKITGNFNLRL